MPRIFVSDERAKELADEVKGIHSRVVLELDEKSRAEKYGFNSDYRFSCGNSDTVEIEHPKKPVSVQYHPDFSRETIATVVVRARTDDVSSPQTLLSRIKSLDEQRNRLMNRGIIGGVFSKYEGDRGMMHSGFQYEFNVPITCESDLDRLLEVCADL